MSIQLHYVGYYIRQLRRDRSLTQTELGNNLFSKSYVSAVENGKLVPSTEALTSFALRLGEVPTYFLELSREIDAAQPSRAIAGLVPQEQATLVQEKAALLEALLEQQDY